MRTRLVRATSLSLLVGSLAALPIAPVSADHPGGGGRPFSTRLTGAAERPGPGDPDGSGTAAIRINVGQRELCYQLSVSGIAPATAAHVHKAPAGAPGPVVIGLSAPTSGSSSGCATADRALLKDIIKNSEAYYVNVHNAEFPAGAVRGQLGR